MTTMKAILTLLSVFMSTGVSAQTVKLHTPKMLGLKNQLERYCSSTVVKKGDTSGTADFEKMKGQLIVPADKYMSAKNGGVDLDSAKILFATSNPIIKFRVS